MARSAYPTDSDVAALAASVPLPSGFAFTGMAEAAVDEWERRTGYRPFLGSGTVETRMYDPPGPNRRTLSGYSLLGGGRLLDLGSGLYGLTSVSIGVGPDAPGTPLTLGTDLWLEPLNADLIGVPWQRIRFRAPVFGLESSVAVAGLFGYGATIPEDAWQAIARLGCALGLQAVAEGLRASPTRWSEDAVAESLDGPLLTSLGQAFRTWSNCVIGAYRRVEI